MNLEEIKERLSKFALETYGVNTEKEWVIFALRGVTPENNELVTNDNEPFLFNDTIIIIKGNKIKAYLGSCEPGDFYSNPKNKLDKNGAAHIINGCFEWKTGYHSGKPAFVQNKELLVYRDKNGDGVISKEEKETPFKGWFGVHIHWGSDSPNSHGLRRWIGKWSAGCIIVRSSKAPADSGPEWVDFRDTLYKSGQKIFKGIIEDYGKLF